MNLQMQEEYRKLQIKVKELESRSERDIKMAWDIKKGIQDINSNLEKLINIVSSKSIINNIIQSTPVDNTEQKIKRKGKIFEEEDYIPTPNTKDMMSGDSETITKTIVSSNFEEKLKKLGELGD